MRTSPVGGRRGGVTRIDRNERATARILGACLVVVAAFAGTAAAGTTLDARQLALTERDFPAPARRMSEKETRSARLPGGTGQAYATTFQFRSGRRTQTVGSLVITAPSKAVARKVYAVAVADAKKSAASSLRLPALGDEQYAALYGRPALDEAAALVWVRRGNVVWQVQTASVRNPFGFAPSDALRELKTYATKQRRRVDTG